MIGSFGLLMHMGMAAAAVGVPAFYFGAAGAVDHLHTLAERRCLQRSWEQITESDEAFKKRAAAMAEQARIWQEQMEQTRSPHEKDF